MNQKESVRQDAPKSGYQIVYQKSQGTNVVILTARMTVGLIVIFVKLATQRKAVNMDLFKGA